MDDSLSLWVDILTVVGLGVVAAIEGIMLRTSKAEKKNAAQIGAEKI